MNMEVMSVTIPLIMGGFTNKTTPSLTVEIVYLSVGKIWKGQNKGGSGVVGGGKGR